MSKRKCITDHCDNLLSDRSKLEECQQCRSAFYYWKRKRPAQIIQRRAALTKYGSRLDRNFITKKKGA